MGLISGYLATITVNGVSYEDFTSSATRSATATATDKTKLGESRNTYLKTLSDATLSASLHMDTTIASALEAAYEASDPIAVVFRAGAVGIADAGSYSHPTCILTDLSLSGDADGEWDCSLALQSSGAYTYTPPA